MRRTAPAPVPAHAHARALVAALLAALLLAQWGGAAASCLAALRSPSLAAVLCHAPDASPGAPDTGGQHDPACAHCAPLPPALAAAPPLVPLARAAGYAARPPAPAAPPAIVRAASPFQPRGPPHLA